MNALTFDGAESIRYTTVSDPTLVEATDVVVQVEVAGLCGSDLHVYHGRERGLDLGTVMGHELVGTVLEVGAEVVSLVVGDRVVAPFTTSCGVCFFCHSGLTARCSRGALLGWVENGSGLQGAQAEFVRIPFAESTLVAIGPELPGRQALLAGDVLSTGLFAASLGGVEAGQHVAVIGCGAVGLMAVVGALHAGAERVYAIDLVEERRDRASQFGAVPMAPESAAEEVERLTDGRGLDVVLEAVGNPAASATAYKLVRPGGTLAAVGVHTEPHLAISPAQLYDKNLTYRAGRCSARQFMQPALEILNSARWDFDPVVSHSMPLADGPEAYKMFAARESGCCKVVFEP